MRKLAKDENGRCNGRPRKAVAQRSLATREYGGRTLQRPAVPEFLGVSFRCTLNNRVGGSGGTDIFNFNGLLLQLLVILKKPSDHDQIVRRNLFHFVIPVKL